MARQGDVIHNPVSGERVRFLKTARDTEGELLQFELSLPAHGSVPFEHVHPRQEERFQVLSGTVRLRVGGKERSLAAGEALVGPQGIRHFLWNDSQEEARLIIDLRPPLQFAAMLETFFGLARDGKVDKTGLPSLLRSAVIVSEYPNVVYRARIPTALQKAGIAVLARVGRLLGYRAWKPQYSQKLKKPI